MPSKLLNFSSLILALSILTTSCDKNDSGSKSTGTENSPSVLKITSDSDPTSLDPRKVRDLASITALRMFYDGLMRSDFNGKLIPALAEKVEVSSDMTHYTFTLRESYWSNGEPITAQDFEYSWKSILNPQFSAPNAYQFYLIKGAKAAKEGLISLDQVGIKAVDTKTLVVELENPTPYFLEMTAFHPFFPVNPKWDALSTTDKDAPHQFIASGAFVPETWAHHNVLVAKKNHKYWNAAEVKFDEIQLMTLDSHTALQMFEAGDLHWTGSPMGDIPTDAMLHLKKEGALGIAPAAGTHFFRFNTTNSPFNNKKMRQAFSYALNRKAITEHVLQGGQKPAMSLVPLHMGLQKESYFADDSIADAQALFTEALTELNMTKEQLPTITLSYANNERSHKIAQAVQQQWNKNFGINVMLVGYESKVYFDKLAHQDYQISSGSWFADINDPINFLEVFKYKSNSTNNTLWESPEYITLLDKSSIEANPELRKEILGKAESLLMDEMPIAPLFYYTFDYAKKENVSGIYFSELGYLDLSRGQLIDDNLDTLETPE